MALQWLKQNNIIIFTTNPKAELNYLQANYTVPSAIVMGNEATGLSDDWIENSDYSIKIPMFGHIDSLNVSVSTAIIIFETIRQRLNCFNK
jgi:TrmH family RNA methyltransferase